MTDTTQETITIESDTIVIEQKEEIKAKATSNRFKEADWFNPGLEVVIGGGGGIGSWLSLFLARQEAKLYVYDFDLVEEHNLGGQLYKKSHVGTTKVDAIANVIAEFADSNLIQNMGKFEKDSMIGEYTFSCFDNMAARKMMFQAWKELDNRKLFIDGRMLAEQAQIYIVTPGREAAYEATLFDDSEVEDQPCNYKATSHCGAMIGAYMVSALNNYMTNAKYNTEVRSLPFTLSYELQLLNLDSIDYVNSTTNTTASAETRENPILIEKA